MGWNNRDFYWCLLKSGKVFTSKSGEVIGLGHGWPVLSSGISNRYEMRNKQPSLNSMGKAPGMTLTFLKVLIWSNYTLEQLKVLFSHILKSQEVWDCIWDNHNSEKKKPYSYKSYGKIKLPVAANYGSLKKTLEWYQAIWFFQMRRLWACLKDTRAAGWRIKTLASHPSSYVHAIQTSASRTQV